MATSGSYNLTTTRDAIIASALRKIGILAEGQSATATQISNAAEALNFLTKAWASAGMPLWALKYLYVFPIDGVNTVTIYNNAAGGHVSAEYIGTTLSAGESSSDTSMAVTDGSAIANSDYIGVEQDDGTMLWTTVASGGGTNTIVLTDALTDDAASGNRVYAYTAKAEKPLKVVDAWMINAADSSRIPINIVSESEINSLGNLTSEASYVNQISYVPLISTGRLTFYPQFSNGDYYMLIRAQYPHEDFDSSTDEPAFPQEWYRALTWNLAMEIAPEYGVPSDQLAIIAQMAVMTRKEADDFGAEGASLQFEPDVM